MRVSRRLGRRLVAIVAVGLAIGMAVPTVALVKSRSDRRIAERDSRLGRAALATLIITPESVRHPGRVDTSVYVQTARGPDQPLTAVLNRRGEVLASDRAVPAALRPGALGRARSGDDDAFTVAGLRAVALSIEGAHRMVGVVVAYQQGQPILDARRNDALTYGGVALAGWLLLVGAAALLVRRTLAPSEAAAAREEAFLADAAHELRTPLAVVQARAERAERDGATAEDLRAIQAAAAGAAGTVSDMLELARLDAGRALAEREALDLGALVATCVSEREGGAVDLRLDSAAAVQVRGDERLLARAVGNLLDNALRHGGSGGVVEVAVSAEDGAGVVRVGDRGPGVAPGQRERVFERFHRGGTGGAGLGLPIARLIAEAHGGTLTLEPDGPGAHFTLRLPA
ncbi:MAG: hypothetical protein QOF76_728 [Solirubrobacteraceae bacterium]|nr:hypothetical protein [Solirubrobacteraceae bacterium]